MQKTNLEFKIGLFVLIGVVMLGVIVFSIGDYGFFAPQYTVKIIYSYTAGVEVSAPVRLAGVEVGRVEGIKIFYDDELEKTRVEITASISKSTDIEKDAKAHINSLGLLGERYIEMVPGSRDKGILKDGDILVGVDPIPMEELTRRGYEIADKIDSVLSNLNETVGDPKLKAAVKDAAIAAQELLTNLNEIVVTDKAEIEAMIVNIGAVSEYLSVILSKIAGGEGSLGKLITEDKLYNDFSEFVEDIKEHPWKLFKKR